MSKALVPEVVRSDLSLPELATLAEAEHQQVLDGLQSALVHAVRAGEVLLKARELVPTGQWMRWVRENVPEIAHVTVTKYMRFAAYQEKLVGQDGLTVRGAATLLRELPAVNGTRPIRNDDDVTRARRLRAAGKTLDEIAEELDIGKTTVSRYLNPERTRRTQRANSARAKRERDVQRATTKIQERLARDELVRDTGGPGADAYAKVKGAVPKLEQAVSSTLHPFAREQMKVALSHVRRAETAIVAALRAER